jgi:uncharacterized protein with HEPN domain
MSKRRDIDLLKDIIESANRIQRYVGSFTLAEFMSDTQAQDAVVRNLSIIGEAVKNLSAELREQHQENSHTEGTGCCSPAARRSRIGSAGPGHV